MTVLTTLQCSVQSLVEILLRPKTLTTILIVNLYRTESSRMLSVVLSLMIWLSVRNHLQAHIVHSLIILRNGMRAIGMIVVETKILHLIQITCRRWLNSINLFPVSTIHPGLRPIFQFQFIFFGSKNFKQDSVGLSHRGAKKGVRSVRELPDLTCRWYLFSSNSFAYRFFNMLNFLSHTVFTNRIYF